MGSNESSPTMISGNIKAVIPLIREVLTREELDPNGMPVLQQSSLNIPQNQTRFRRGEQVPLTEKRIFGVMTPHQLGFIPNVSVCFTQDDSDE